MNRLVRIALTALIVVLVGLLVGCGGPSTPLPKGHVAKIIATQNYYNILIENEGVVVTKQYPYHRVTFVTGLKADEQMWIEPDPNDGLRVIVHVHTIRLDIQTQAE
jgi:hypothetical protein